MKQPHPRLRAAFAEFIASKLIDDRYEPDARQYVERGQPQTLFDRFSRWRARG